MDPNAHILPEEDHPFGMESFFQSKRVPLQGACPIMCTLHVLCMGMCNKSVPRYTCLYYSCWSIREIYGCVRNGRPWKGLNPLEKYPVYPFSSFMNCCSKPERSLGVITKMMFSFLFFFCYFPFFLFHPSV